MKFFKLPDALNKRGIASKWKKFTSGFTLVELVVVIAILAILSGIGVLGYNGYIEKAREAEDIALFHAVNTAFSSACIDEGLDGLPVNALADFAEGTRKISTISILQKKGDDVQDLTSEFMRFYEGNENSEFKVFKELAYVQGSGFIGCTETKNGMKFTFDNGSTLTRGKTDINGNTTWEWEKDGEKYSLTTKKQDVEDFANSFGKNMSMESLMQEVDNVVKAASSLGIGLSSMVLGDDYMQYLSDHGVDTTSPDVLASAIVLKVADKSANWTTDDLYTAIVEGDTSGLVSGGSDGIGDLVAFVAAGYGVITDYANSETGKSTTINVDGKEMTVQEYYQSVSADLSSATGGSDGLGKVMNMITTMNSDPNFKSYMEEHGREDIDGYLAAMRSIQKNKDAWTDSGSLEDGFGDSSVSGLLGALFGNG